MKQIINGKIYNTDTATQIGEYWNGLAASDFGYCYEILYRTKRGAYFVHGMGGAASAWSEAVGDARTGSEGIKPLTEREALDWAERNEWSETVLEHFSHILEEA